MTPSKIHSSNLYTKDKKINNTQDFLETTRLRSAREFVLSPKLKANWALVLALLLVLLFVAFFSYLSIMRHERLQTRGYDLGNYDQAIWNTAHGRPFEFTNWKGKDDWFVYPTRLGMHVEPILLLVAPLYWLWENVRTILILQAAVVGFGALGIFLLARWKFSCAVNEHSDHSTRVDTGFISQLSALALAAAFLLNPALQWAVLDYFHGVTLVAGLLPFALYFMLRQRYGWFLVFAVLIASTKEEMPLMVAMMGLYIVVFQAWRGDKPDRRRQAFLVGSMTFLLGVLWSAIAFTVIIPHYNVGDASPYLERYDAILGDGGITLIAIPKIAIAVLGEFLKPDALSYIIGLLAPTAFLALFDWPLLLIGGFTIVINVLSDSPIQRVQGRHYIAPLIPLVLAATVTGIYNLTARLQNKRGLAAHIVPDKLQNMQTAGLHLLFAILALSFTVYFQYDTGFTPLSSHFVWPAVQPHHRLAQRFFDQIPPDASVSVQQSLNPHLTHRREITILPFDVSGEYLLIDLTRDWQYSDHDIHEWLLENVAHRPGYGVIDAADGFMLLQRGAPQQAVPDAFYDIFRADEATPQYPQQVDFDNAIRFLGFDITSGAEMDLYFQALQPVDRDLLITLYLTDADYQLHGGVERRQSAHLWFPTSQWTPGEVVRIPFRRMPLNSRELGTFSFVLGVLEGDDLWNAGLRLPPTPLYTEQNPRRIDGGTLWHLMRFRWEDDEIILLPDPVLEAPPPTSTQTDAQFGDLARLEGYEVHTSKPTPGDELAVNLYWRALEPTDTSYTVFFQVVGPDGRIYAQQDNPPGQGTLRTDWWQSAMLVPDAYRVVIAPDAPSGDYVIHIGFYNPSDGQRIDLADGSGNNTYAIPFQVH